MNEELVQQIRDAVLDMMKRVKFEEENHIYTSTENGDWLQGVSTVSSIIPKDWLSAWGAKEAVKALGYSDYEGDTEKALSVWEKIKACKKVEDYIAILKEAKGASRKKSKEALIDGEQGHALLEKYVKAKIRGEEEPVPTDNLVRPFNQFKEWAEKNVDYWILSEARVAYPEKGYAGQLDALAMMKTGKLAVIDFKFASHLSEDYNLQTAGYQATFEPYGIKIDQRIIVRLPKTLMTEEWDKEQKVYKKVENNIEIKELNDNYEEEREVFFHCLPVKKWINKNTK